MLRTELFSTTRGIKFPSAKVEDQREIQHWIQYCNINMYICTLDTISKKYSITWFFQKTWNIIHETFIGEKLKKKKHKNNITEE